MSRAVFTRSEGRRADGGERQRTSVDAELDRVGASFSKVGAANFIDVIRVAQ